MAWKSRGGGGWTTYMSSAKAKSGRATKEEIKNASLILPHVPTLAMGNYMQVGVTCGECVHFQTCPKAGKQNYCLYRPGRFVSRNLIQ